jgi:putative hydrolase of the HAD superfamily
MTEQRFMALLSEYAEPSHLTERLLEAEKRNLPHYAAR